MRDRQLVVTGLLALLLVAHAVGAAPAARMGMPEVTVLLAERDRTVVQIEFPAELPAEDWQRAGVISWAGLDVDLLTDDGPPVRQDPFFSRLITVAAPTRPDWQILAATWWRDPDDARAAPVTVTAPVRYRGVDLASIVVSPEAGGGILRRVVVAVSHPLPDARKVAESPAVRRAGGEPVPAAVVNPATYRRARRLSAADAEARAAAKDSHDDAFSVTSNWLRVEVEEDGLYQVTGADFESAGIALAAVDPARLRVFRGGGLVLPDDPEETPAGTFPGDRLTEIAVDVRDGGDGEWNLTDDVIFHGLAAATWGDWFDPAAERLDHAEHPQQVNGVYWLTWEDEITDSPFTGAPLRVVSRAAPPAGGSLVTSHLARYHGEENVTPVLGWFQDNWAWDGSVRARFTKTFSIEGVVAGEAAFFAMELAGIRGSILNPPAFEVAGYFNEDIGNGVDFSWFLNSQNTFPAEPIRFSGTTTALVPGSNRVVLDYDNYEATRTFLAYNLFQLEYTASLDKADYSGALFASFWGEDVVEPGTSTDVRFTVPTGSNARVWDLTDPLAVAALEGEATAGTLTLGLEQDPGQDRHLVLFSDADLRQPPVRARAEIAPLRQSLAAADYLVIHPTEFAAAAARLAALRSRHLPGVTDPVALAVAVEDIFANYSGGQKDWRAIRQFLKDQFEEHGQRLRWACLLGDASIDHHNNFGYEPGTALLDWIPTELVNSWPRVLNANDLRGPFTTDDSLVSLDSPPEVTPESDAPDLGVGRLPAINAAQALALVERLEEYVDTPTAGPWRNRVLMAADDLRYRGEDPYWSQEDHTNQAELLASAYLPHSLDVSKIYLLEYPLVGIYKPDARRDLLSSLNDGTTIFYYVGHGAAVTLADEHLFEINDVASLGNAQRRFVFIAFSCDVGIYADPNTQCMAEEFLLSSQGGAIGSIAASWVSSSFSNDPLSEAFMEEYYQGRHVVADASLGEALSRAKLQMWNDSQSGQGYFRNARRYNLIGDPAVRLPNPLDDLQYASDSADSLLTGRIHQVALDPDAGDLQIGAGSTYRLEVVEAPVQRSFIARDGSEWFYQSVPNAVFRGNGSLDREDVVIPFLAPLFMRTGDDGTLRLVVDDGSELESMAVQQVPVVQVAASSGGDVTGPQIELRFAGGRNRVEPGASLTASLADTNGVNILATNPANSVLLEFDRSGIYNNVSDDVVFSPGSYTRAALTTSLPTDLDAGRHTLVMTASDMFGNVGSDTLSFELGALGVDAISQATVFPNPTSGPCRMVCDLSGPMDLEWDIFTVAGHRIRRIEATFTTAGPAILDWDGRDQEGDTIANGVYLYVLRGKVPGDDHELRETGQLVIMR